MKLADILGSLQSRKTSLADIRRDIAKLEQERGQLLAAPPDKAAVLRWALRAVDRAETDFAEHLQSWYLAEENIGQVSGEWYDASPGPRWLEKQDRCPGIIEDSADGQANAPVDFDRKALMALLAPQLRESIPKWIEAHFPFQKGSLSSDERAARLADVEKRLADLQEQLERTTGELLQASDEIQQAINE